MKRLILLLALAASILNGSAKGASFEDQFHERMLEVGWRQCLMELNQYSADEKRYILERAILAFGPDSIPRTPERQANFEIAQSTMLSIPGHAKYFQDKIEEMRAAVLADSKMPPEEISKMQIDGKKIHWEVEYLCYGTAAIRTLRYMPSAETVSVRGHFLNDPEGRDGKTLLGNDVVHPGDDFQRRPSHDEIHRKFPHARVADISVSFVGSVKDDGVIVGLDLKSDGKSAYGLTNREGTSTHPGPTCWILGEYIGKQNGKYAQLDTVAHEFGHVFVDYGHPDEISNRGHAPLPGMEKQIPLRLMCSGPKSSIDSRLLVKGEWDEAEKWMKTNIKDEN